MRVKYKIGIISCEDSPGWGGEEGLCNYIKSRLNDVSTGVEFVHFHAITGSLPTKAETKDLTGIIISGSHHSVNDGYAWISNLIDYVRFLNDQTDAPKIFGICFGHQLIAKALGGKVEKNKSGKFVWGTEEIEVDNSLMEDDKFIKCFGVGRNRFKIAQSHGEWVSILPEGAMCIGKSPTCQYEVLTYGDKMLTAQGHPELRKKAMVENILPRLLKNGVLNDLEAKRYSDAMNDEDQHKLMNYVFKFLVSV